MKKQPDPIDVKVGQNIRSMRVVRGMSQEKLAEGLGITFQQVQKYEKGTNRVSASKLQQIAGILGTEISVLFGGTTSSGAVSQVPAFSNEAVKAAIAFDAIADHKQRAAVLGLMRSLAGAVVGTVEIGEGTTTIDKAREGSGLSSLPRH